MPELQAIGNNASEMIPCILFEVVPPGIQRGEHVLEVSRPIAAAEFFELRSGLELEAHARGMDVFTS